MKLFGPVDFIILSWECHGFLVVGFGEGLNDTRSGLFMDMVRLITQAQSISPMLGYVIENTPSVATLLWPSVGVKPNTWKK
jgi:site-specific DNA-cytosine methylase